MLLPLLVSGLLAGPPCAQLDGARGDFRPSLSGPEEVFVTSDGRFAIHWTAEGGDRPEAMDDADGDGIPDGIERVAAGLVAGAAAFEADGWRPVVDDGGGGGTPGIDVYVRDIDAFGFAYPLPGEGGSACFMELDPNNTSFGDGMAESVAAHELHHCVQYAYSISADSWIYEATATFEQYRLFVGPVLDLGLGVLWNQRLRGMDRRIDDVGDRYEYAGFLLLKHLSDRGRGEASAEALWGALAEDPSWEAALDAVAASELGEPSWREAFGTYALWNLFACARDDGAHYDEASHPCLFEAAQVDVVALEQGAGGVDLLATDAPYTALYAELPAGQDDRPLEVACAVDPEEAEAELRLVAIDSAGAGGEVAAAAADGGEVLEARLLDPVEPWGSFGIVVASTGAVPAEVRCGLARIDPEPEPDPGGGCACSAGGPGGVLPGLVLVAAARARRRTWTRASSGSSCRPPCRGAGRP